MAALLNNLGIAASEQGDTATACQFLEESLAIYRSLDDRPHIAAVLCNLGGAANERSGEEQDLSPLQESLVLFRELNDQAGTATALQNLGEAACQRGDWTEGRQCLEESLRLRLDLKASRSIAETLEALAWVAAAEEQHSQAIALLAAVRESRDRMRFRLSPSHRQQEERTLQKLRQAVPPEEFSTIWSQARDLTLEAAARQALGHEGGVD